MTDKASILYCSHGGGPMPLLNDPGHRRMVEFMRAFPATIPTPDAILVISAHWEETKPSVIANTKPGLLFDYYGFPPETYLYNYPVRGNPALAEEILTLLQDSHIQGATESERGLDHGVFVPLILMYPEATIPVVQLSLVRGLDPALHLEIGQALGPLTSQNLLVIGSGFSFHNMRGFQLPGAEADLANGAFQDWLIETCAGDYSEEQRIDMLLNWESAPHARFCHPREEHLLPLHVCAGMSATPGKIVFDDMILGKRALGILF